MWRESTQVGNEWIPMATPSCDMYMEITRGKEQEGANLKRRELEGEN